MFPKKKLINYSDKEYTRDENSSQKYGNENKWDQSRKMKKFKILEEKQFISKFKICGFCCTLFLHVCGEQGQKECVIHRA